MAFKDIEAGVAELFDEQTVLRSERLHLEHESRLYGRRFRAERLRLEAKVYAKARRLQLKVPLPALERAVCCLMCEEEFGTAQGLESHHRRVHVESPSPNTVSCRVCHQPCSGEYALSRHFPRWHAEEHRSASRANLTRAVHRLTPAKPKSHLVQVRTYNRVDAPLAYYRVDSPSEFYRRRIK